MKRNLILCLIFCCAMVGCHRNDYVRDFTPLTNFEALWNIIDTKYCYLDEKKIDWDGVKKVYEPKVAEVKSVVELFDVLAQMLDTLQDGHVNLYAPFDVSKCSGWYEDWPENFSSSILYSNKYLGADYRMSGGFEYALIDDGNIGYIRYSSFSNAFSAYGLLYIDAIFEQCKGIIIDVRNNGGGSLEYSAQLAASFFAERTITGYISHKTGPGHNDFSEPEPFYTDPENAPIDWSKRHVAVLCNRRSYSATNDFVNRVKMAPRVTVFGGRTGGGGGMPLSSELPCGWMVRFSAVPMYDAEMNTTEFGVDPDVFVTMDSASMAQGRDEIIEQAIAHLNKFLK
ncbi:MAG: S41 family peptidase [Bacteroidales bacterium]|nr:S41 family peptidase [Bacteroidales bacterium]